MIKGTVEQLRLDHLLTEGCCGVQVADDDAAVAASLMGPGQGSSGRFRDDLTGQLLNDALVEEARATELVYFNSNAACNWRATNLDLYFGLSSPPLLTPTHLTVIGARPVF